MSIPAATQTRPASCAWLHASESRRGHAEAGRHEDTSDIGAYRAPPGRTRRPGPRNSHGFGKTLMLAAIGSASPAHKRLDARSGRSALALGGPADCVGAVNPSLVVRRPKNPVNIGTVGESDQFSGSPAGVDFHLGKSREQIHLSARRALLARNFERSFHLVQRLL
jgi:hypothetical protein